MAYYVDACTMSRLLRYYAGWSDKLQGSTVPIDGPYFSYTRFEPVGIVGAIIPWNFPGKRRWVYQKYLLVVVSYPLYRAGRHL
jgi:acyl-CoA reductase-like NAD-dependent aldehyde dehydrogenase